MPISDGGKEQLRLEAQFLNTLANNLLAIGVIGPIATAVYVQGLADDRAVLAAGFGFLCFFGSFALHLTARLRLRELDE